MNTRIEDYSKRRDRHDIIVEILKSAIGGNIKTRILYEAKLSCAQLYEFLPILVANGFLESTTIKHKKRFKSVFKTTLKGMSLLENFENINQLWSNPAIPCEGSHCIPPFNKYARVARTPLLVKGE